MTLSIRLLCVTFLTLWLLTASSLTPSAAAATATRTISVFLGDVTESSAKKLASALARTGATAVTVPVAWSRVEPQMGRFTLEVYASVFDAFTQAGLRLIIVLDSSGRKLRDARGRLTGERALPPWLVRAHPDVLDRDFLGNEVMSLDIFNLSHRPFLDRFYRRATRYFRARYGSHIVAVAPGISDELEIKFSQENYLWRGYSDEAQASFKAFLHRQGELAARLPVLAYNNIIAGGHPAIEHLLPLLMEFREQALADYVCALTRIIHAARTRTVGYFGEVFSGHDAIYTTGVIERLPQCIDTAVLDYNFYDGWTRRLQPFKLPLMISYARSLGYDELYGGVYLERLLDARHRLDPAYLPAVRKALRLSGDEPGVAGMEIGGIASGMAATLEQLPLRWFATAGSSADRRRPVLGLVGSMPTFYLWHGELSNMRNVFADALYSSYKLLTTRCCVVRLLGDPTLQVCHLEHYDALVFPHVTTLSPEARLCVRRYWESGGRVIQDARLGEFHPAGRSQWSIHGWENGTFGLDKAELTISPGSLRYRNEVIRIPAQDRLYFSHALLAPDPASGFELRMQSVERPGTGLLLRGPRSLLFGFLPQLLEDETGSRKWRDIYVSEIAALIDGTGAKGAPNTKPSATLRELRR